MADTSKIISIRANDELIEKFRVLLEAEGIKAADMLERLLSTYDTVNLENSMPAHKAELQDFQTHLTALSTKFNNAYTTLSNTESRLKQTYESKIEQLESQIQRHKDNESAKIDALARVHELELVNDDLRKQNKLLQDRNDFNDSLIEKVKIADELQQQLNDCKNDMKVKEAQLAASLEQINDLKQQLADERKRIDDLISRLSN